MVRGVDIETAVAILVRDPDLARVGAAAKELGGTPGATAKASALPDYGRALDRLLNLARTSAKQTERLQALAILGRLRKQHEKSFAGVFETRLSEAIPPLVSPPSSLKEANEREYLALALKTVSFNGIVDYLAEFIVGESAPESKARNAAALALLERARSLGEAFRVLDRALGNLSHDTQDPAASHARRLNWTLEALMTALRQTDPDVDRETGVDFAALLQRSSPPATTERKLRIELAIAALDVLEAWVRPNFSMARHAEAFSAVSVLNRLFAPARWPDETLGQRDRVARVVTEAIRMLAEAGVTDDGMRATLIALLEAPAAQARLRRIASQTPGLANEVRHWLETGRGLAPLQNADAVGETLVGAYDQALAEAFREAGAALRLLGFNSNDIQDQLAISSGRYEAVFAEMAATAGALAQKVESLGAQRGFRLDGELGTIVEYAPRDHDSDDSLAGQRVVRVIAPRVVRSGVSGLPQTVVKAKVEPI